MDYVFEVYDTADRKRWRWRFRSKDGTEVLLSLAGFDGVKEAVADAEETRRLLGLAKVRIVPR